MDYHILEIYTLKAISRDVDREITKIKDRLRKLEEQKEIIDLIIMHRDKNDPHRHVDSDALIDPLK